ncbi:MAG: type IV toxin-antitoxin system AbiEi family antitoxin domain-containing protein [Candidatus Margulisbacteria bacterium]|nr:type IV toxin-antitoxin system AbiEi family antitoxin domain-containing protein [Candidatus Margulisiibacteriota bacterium]
MTRKNMVHSRLGTDFIRKLSTKGDRIFTSDRGREIAPSVGISEDYFNQMLHHLTKAGWLVRIRKGLYALSSTVPGVTPAHEYEIAMALVDPSAIAYWSALNYHGLSDQIPRKVFIQTLKNVSIPRDRTKKVGQSQYQIEGFTYHFIQIKPERFFGTEKVWVGEAKVTITDPERTLLDGLMMPYNCGDFSEVLSAFEIRKDNLEVKKIIDYALKLDTAVAKRLGWVLEEMEIDPNLLRPLEELPIKGYRPLDPTNERKGPCNKRWRLQENLPGRINK